MIGEDVRSLVELFEQSDLTELSIEQRGRKLFLRKGQVNASTVPEAPGVVDEPQRSEVKAHMVGVFYWSQEKSGKPSVALHQRLEKGQLVGFIEAMGIMNEVEAGQPGSIVEIVAAGGQPVEYGQPLIVIEPD